MKLIGYKKLSDNGFSLPLYSYNRSNALFVALCDIDGDHNSVIYDFDVVECDIDGFIPSEPEVEVGSPWCDVFLFNGKPFVGSPERILEDSVDLHGVASSEAPLSFLDLVLASGSRSAVNDAVRARAFLEMKLGSEEAEGAFQEIVLRPGVSLEIRRNRSQFFGERDFPPALRNFEINQIDASNFSLAFSPVASEYVNAKYLEENIEIFSRRVGIKFIINGLDKNINEDIVSDKIFDDGGIEEIGYKKRSTRLFGMVREMALDIGTANTMIFEKDRGLIVSEPSVVAIEKNGPHRRLIAVGDAALIMKNKTAGNIEVIRPLRNGAIVDIDVAVMMIRHFVDRVRGGGRLRRPLDVIICAPSGSTLTERRAIQSAAKQAGASQVLIIEAPIAAAIGAGISIAKPVGTMIVNIGGGVTEVAIISLGALAYVTSVRSGGDVMDHAIISYMRWRHNLLIGEGLAERLKKDFAVAYPPSDGEGLTIHIKGVDIANRIPKEVSITQADICEAISDSVKVIISGVRIALENAAPELSSDIMEGGIVLTGGGALLYGLDERIQQETGIKVSVADDPISSVANGLGKIMDDTALRGLLQQI